MTEQCKEIKENRNCFIIQYLRKSKLGDGYLARYLNMILESLLNNNNDDNNSNSHFKINIRGGCWSKTFGTAFELVSKVFDNINLLNTEVILDNHYPGYNKEHTSDALCSYICNSCSHSHHSYLYYPSYFCHSCHSCHFGGSCGCFYTDPGTDRVDHSKEIFIECSGELVFYLVGSSNFSKNTYITRDRNIDQTDIAFIKYSDSTKYLISSIVEKNANDNILLKNFANELNELNNLNDEDETIDYYSSYIENIKPYIITAPYIGSQNIIKDIIKREQENRLR